MLGVVSCLNRRGGAKSSGDDHGEVRPSTLPGTIARVVVPLPDSRGVVLAGQRRTGSGGSDAWIAAFDLEGGTIWEQRVGAGFAWAEDVLVDPAGGVHVFGRDVEAGAWFLHLDAEGGRRGYARLPAGERLGFARTGTQVHLFIAEPRQSDDAELSVSWLRVDWTQMYTQPQQAKLTLDGLVDPGWWPDIEPVGPMLLEIDGAVHRVEPEQHGEGFRSTERDEAVLEAPSQRTASSEATAIVPLELHSIDLGMHELLLLQMPPVISFDASLLLQAVEKPGPPAVRTAFAAHAARSLASTDASSEKGEHDWAWLWPFVEHDIDRYAQDVTLGVWLGAGTCDPVDLVTDCDGKGYAYPSPQYFAPADPCWRRGQLEASLGTFGRSTFRANFDAFVGVLRSSYFHGPMRGGLDQTYTLDDPLLDELFEVARKHGMAEQLIRAMVFDFDDHRAGVHAIELLERLEPTRRDALAQALLSELRTDRRRCDAVVQLTNAIAAAGLERPTWEADLENACDVLYVLCTGLQPNLQERVVSPRGVEYVATCGDDRPATAAEAEFSLLSICQPQRWIESTLDYEISPEIAASCGSNAALLELRHSCGVSADFDRVDVELVTGPDGIVLIERVHILRTSVN